MDENEKRYFEFCRDYGYIFSKPYENEKFDFGDPGYIAKIKGFTKNAPLSNQPRGNKNFIYSTRVHLGLYHLLMKLKANISTKKSIEVVENALNSMQV